MRLIEKAIQVAAKAHDHQYRKSSGIPYVSHPFTVGMILMKANCSEETIAAGILHDVVEDTEITLLQIREMFGPRVAQIVEGCSEPDKTLTWEERKSHTIEYLKNAPIEVKLVAGADKLHNCRAMLEEQKRVGERVWERFKRGREKQAWYYRSLIDSLSTGLGEREKQLFIFTELTETVERLFGREEG